MMYWFGRKRIRRRSLLPGGSWQGGLRLRSRWQLRPRRSAFRRWGAEPSVNAIVQYLIPLLFSRAPYRPIDPVSPPRSIPGSLSTRERSVSRGRIRLEGTRTAAKMPVRASLVNHVDKGCPAQPKTDQLSASHQDVSNSLTIIAGDLPGRGMSTPKASIIIDFYE
jgi:hypothetical protein